MFRLATAAAIAVVCTSSPILANDEPHQRSPHEHGRATLTINFQGNKITTQLEAPGLDIVGFEHAAATEAERVREVIAKTVLTDPAALLKLPVAAGCNLDLGKVELENDLHREPERDQAPGSTGHTAFHAEYIFDCKAPANVSQIDFPYFNSFGATRKIEVTVVARKGQTKFEVGRDAPHIDLTGIM